MTGPIAPDVLVDWLHLPNPDGVVTLARARELREHDQVDDDSTALAVAVAELRAGRL